MAEDLSLGCAFSGVGRFEAGLAVAGWRASWQIEANPFRRRILEARFGVEVVPDVREAKGMPKVRGMAGGFPCQDLSAAGPGAGIGGSRSSLWGEYARLIGEIEPEIVFIENVPPLLYRGFDVVLADLVEMGYGVEWDCIPAAAVGAPHLRDRVWIVARKGALEPGVFGDPASLFPEPPLPMEEGPWRRWPRAGFATDPNAALTLQPLAPLAEVKRGLVLWPTPHGIAKEKGQRRRPGPSGNELGRAVNNADRGAWPTPTVSDSKGATPNLQRDGSPNLAERVAELPERWPTPDASVSNLGEDLENWEERRERERAKGRNGNGFGMPLAIAAQMWPTPSASDGTGGRNEIGAVDRALEEGQESLRTLSRPSGAKAAVSLRTAAVIAERGLWPTPKASPSGPDYAREGRERSGGDDLVTAVSRDRWPTPRASDGDARNRGDLIAHAKERPNTHHPGERAEGREEERRPGSLNPPWVECLMGMPLGWTDPDLPNEELGPSCWPVGPSEEPPPEEPPRTADNVQGRLERLAACGDSLIAEIPALVAIRRPVR